MVHRFGPASLREYEIRDIVTKTLPPDATAIGRGSGSWMRRPSGTRLASGETAAPIRCRKRRWSKG